MSHSIALKSLFAAFLLAASCIAGAQTMYVSDELVITFRTGPSNQNNILRNLSSGDRVQVLEQLDDEGYSRVRLDDGSEGFVLTQYLQSDRTGDQLYDEAARELAAVRNTAESAGQQATDLDSQLGATRDQLASAQAEVQRLDAELSDVLEASASALETREQNASLRRRISDLTAQVDLAEAEIRELRSRNRQSWFIVGAGVLFGGIVIGLVAPSLRRKRRSDW